MKEVHSLFHYYSITKYVLVMAFYMSLDFYKNHSQIHFHLLLQIRFKLILLLLYFGFAEYCNSNFACNFEPGKLRLNHH